MQPPPEPQPVEAPPERPVAAGLASGLAAAVGAVLVIWISGFDSDSARIGVSLVIFLGGLGLTLVERIPDADWLAPRLLPRWPERAAIGTAFAVAGGYLFGLSIILGEANAVPPHAPSAFVQALLIFGLPALGALAALRPAVRVAAPGLAILLVPLVDAELAIKGVAPNTVTSVDLLAALLALVAVRRLPDGQWARGLTMLAAVAAGSTAGLAGVVVGSTQTGASVLTATAGQRVSLIVLGLLLSAGVLLVAVLRRDVASGVVAAVTLVSSTAAEVLPGAARSSGLVAALVVVPVLALLGAALLIAADRGRYREAAGLLGGLAVLLFALRTLDDFGWPVRAVAVLQLALLLVVAVAAWWQPPGRLGAILAAAVLFAVSVRTPLFSLVSREGAPSPAAAAAQLAVVAALGVVLTARHRHPGVLLGSCYGVLTCVAALIGHERPTDLVAVVLMPLMLTASLAAVAGWLVPRRLVGYAQAIATLAIGAGTAALIAAESAARGAPVALFRLAIPTDPLGLTSRYGVDDLSDVPRAPAAVLGLLAATVVLLAGTWRRRSPAAGWVGTLSIVIGAALLIDLDVGTGSAELWWTLLATAISCLLLAGLRRVGEPPDRDAAATA